MHSLLFQACRKKNLQQYHLVYGKSIPINNYLDIREPEVNNDQYVKQNTNM